MQDKCLPSMPIRRGVLYKKFNIYFVNSTGNIIRIVMRIVRVRIPLIHNIPFISVSVVLISLCFLPSVYSQSKGIYGHYQCKIIQYLFQIMPLCVVSCRSISHSIAILPVRLLTGENIDSGNLTVLPATMITAIVSPIARPMPKTIAAIIPDFTSGNTMCQVVCHWVAPKAKEPSFQFSIDRF